jgi:hypothetical protein
LGRKKGAAHITILLLGSYSVFEMAIREQRPILGLETRRHGGIDGVQGVNYLLSKTLKTISEYIYLIYIALSYSLQQEDR